MRFHIDIKPLSYESVPFAIRLSDASVNVQYHCDRSIHILTWEWQDRIQWSCRWENTWNARRTIEAGSTLMAAGTVLSRTPALWPTVQWHVSSSDTPFSRITQRTASNHCRRYVVLEDSQHGLLAKAAQRRYEIAVVHRAEMAALQPIIAAIVMDASYPGKRSMVT